jgi:hypothetical protein
MRIKLLVASALLDDGKSGGLYEEHDVSDGRGAYLVSIGAAEEVKAPAKKTPAKKADDGDEKTTEKKAAPARRPAPRKQS